MDTTIKLQPLHAALVHDLAALQKALDLIMGLPRDVRTRVVLPHSACTAVERSMFASRLRAFDEDGKLCVYQHDYKLAAVDFDSDDDPYVRVSLHETVTAVRTSNGNWLRRVERTEPERESGPTHSDTGFRVARAAELPR